MHPVIRPDLTRSRPLMHDPRALEPHITSRSFRRQSMFGSLERVDLEESRVKRVLTPGKTLDVIAGEPIFLWVDHSITGLIVWSVSRSKLILRGLMHDHHRHSVDEILLVLVQKGKLNQCLRSLPTNKLHKVKLPQNLTLCPP